MIEIDYYKKACGGSNTYHFYLLLLPLAMKEIVHENTEWEEERDGLGHVICYTKVTTTEEITDNVPCKRVTKIPFVSHQPKGFVKSPALGTKTGQQVKTQK